MDAHRPRVRLVVIGKDAEALAGFSLKNVLPDVEEVVLVANLSRRSYASIVNEHLLNLAPQVLGVVHADTAFGRGAVGRMVYETLNVDTPTISGLVGRKLDGTYIWAKKIEATTEVSVLDGCSIFIPCGWHTVPLLDGTVFDGLHLSVEDYCLRLRQLGFRIVVPPVAADHRGDSTLDPAWQNQYRYYRNRFDRRWEGKIEYCLC